MTGRSPRRLAAGLALAHVGALLAVVCMVSLLPADATSEERVSPHQGEDGCLACHVGDAAEPGGIGKPKPVVVTCRGCHPDADMHPVDIQPRNVQMAKGFPVDESGRMTCASCHDEPSHGRPVGPSPWFRGGPYPSSAQFCHTCHDREQLQLWNPHHAPDRDDPRESSCSACHTRRPPEGASVADAMLRLQPEAVCATCHQGMPHYGAAEHFGKEAPAGVGLPLANGKIACFTCHEVHAEGVAGDLDKRLPAALHAAAMRGEWSHLEGVTFPGTDQESVPMLRAPLEDGQLCAACHGEGP